MTKVNVKTAANSSPEMIEAIRIRFAIYVAGGMAAKSVVEEVMMIRFPALSAGDARDISNAIEANQLDAHVLRRKAWNLGGAAPTVADYPELRKISSRRHYLKFD